MGRQLKDGRAVLVEKGWVAVIRAPAEGRLAYMATWVEHQRSRMGEYKRCCKGLMWTKWPPAATV